MKIDRVAIPRQFKDKIISKHQIELDEIHEVFKNKPLFRRLDKGNVRGEDVYGAYGRTNAGRYMSIFFIYKMNHDALVISARNMDNKERRRYVKTET